MSQSHKKGVKSCSCSPIVSLFLLDFTFT
uniref:Uncharacterized protein n=1 Tax=Arundo donax TaxID=35708 RepID=A0A0A9A984_ARUDO